jgi:4,5-dihydroxyphthalate decarboxylase
MSADKPTLRAAIGDYAHTKPLKSGAVQSDRLGFDFADITPVYKAFKPMVRELAFDVSEMAIATFVQAKAYGKPLVLLPAVMMGRFQHGFMFYNSDRGTLTPADLPGKRIGVRAYSQTTGAWLRGILANDYGVDLSRVQWVTFEDGHVAEVPDPPGVERAPPGKDMTQMLLDGEIDAAIYGAELDGVERLKSVIRDPQVDAEAWFKKYGVVPVNHLVVVTEKLAKSSPDSVREVYRLLRDSKQAAGYPKPGGRDTIPFGADANRPAFELMIKYLDQQKLLPRRITVDELFDDTTRKLQA